MLKKFLLLLLIIVNFFLFATTHADSIVGQTLQISTHLKSLCGKPSWLLIIRNVNTGKILPYVYDIRNEDNYWIALTEGQAYRVTVSTLKWGPFAQIHNFCHLENGILIKKSMWITLTGDIGLNKKGLKCSVIQYAD